MKVFPRLAGAILIGSIISGNESAFSQNIPILNSNFNSPVEGTGALSSYNVGGAGSSAITDWIISGTAGTNGAGVWNPTGYWSNSLPPIPGGGDQVGYINGNGGNLAVSQTLTNDLQPYTTYKLAIYVGGRTDAGIPNPSQYAISLYGGAQLLASVTPVAIAPYSWNELTATYITGSCVAANELLGISISASAIQLDFVGVSLNATPSVHAPGSPPTVALTSPTNTATFTAGTNLTIVADASEPGGTIAQVAFIADGIQIGAASTAPYSIIWTNVTVGEHLLTAIATDALCANATSAPVNISVSALPPVPFTLFNTGIDDNGALLVPGAIDPHYSLITSADLNASISNAYVLDSNYVNSLAASEDGVVDAYLNNGPDSEWIGPSTSETGSSSPGIYIYRTTFDLSGYDTSSAMISGFWLTDSDGLNINLNGQPTGIRAYWEAPSQWWPISISSGFVSGVNTMDFVVTNNVPTDVYNPTSLRVRLTGTAIRTNVTTTLTVDINSASRAYGVTNPLFTGMISNLQSGDDITATYASAATVNSNIGPYAIVPVFDDPGHKLTNYTIVINGGTLTITQAVPLLNWSNPADIQYGNPLTGSQLNATANVPGTPNYIPPLGTVLMAGSGQTLSVKLTPNDRTNYTTATASATFNVQPAPLTNSADNKAVAFGVPLPPLTSSYQGLVNGDTPATLTTPVVLGTTATNGSPAGVYPITNCCATSPNYNISFVPGTLTITNVPLVATITINDATVTAPAAGTTNAVFTVTLSAPGTQPVSVNFATSDGTARAGTDYVATIGTLTFSPGITNQLIPVSVIGHATTNSADVSFSVNLSVATGATLTRSQGTGTILETVIPLPSVVLVTPTDQSSYCLGTAIPLLASVSNSASPPTNVTFYYQSTNAVGAADTAPYGVSWSPTGPGDYSLTAVASFSDGTTLASAQALVAVTTTCGQVAIVRSEADPEIALLQTNLFQLGLGSQVFDQAGLSAEILTTFELIIWDGLAATSPTTPSTRCTAALPTGFRSI